MTRIKSVENRRKETSHRHWCDVVGHYYQCSEEECVCICDLPMNGNDHSECPVELRTCHEHESLQSPISEDTLPQGVVEIKFPDDWQHSNQVHCQCGCTDADTSEVVGWCLWCDHVYTEYTPAIQDDHFAHHCLEAPTKLKEVALASLAKRMAGK